MAAGLRRWLRWGPPHEDALLRLVPALFVTAVLEALLGRAVSRAAPLIPRSPAADAFFEALGRGGVLLLNLALVLVVAVLVLLLMSIRAGTRRPPPHLPAGPTTALGTAFLIFGAVSLAVSDPWILFSGTTLFLALAIALLAGAFLATSRPWPRAFAVLVVACYVGSRYIVLASTVGQAGGSGFAPAGALEAVRFAEAAATLAPVALFAHAHSIASGRGRGAVPVLLPSIAAAAFLAPAVASPAITAAIAEAAFGFTMYLPLPVYALGLWLAIASFLLLWRAGERDRALGIALLMTAGVDLRLAYQLLLAAAGLLLWTLDVTPAEPTPATVARTAPALAPAVAVDSGPAARG